MKHPRRESTSLLTRVFAPLALLGGATLAACVDGGGHRIAEGEPEAQLRIGDLDPKAPPGWPLAIGDSISDPDWFEMVGDYPRWEGNWFVNEIDGVHYYAAFDERRGPEPGERDDRRIFKGMEVARTLYQRRWERLAEINALLNLEGIRPLTMEEYLSGTPATPERLEMFERHGLNFRHRDVAINIESGDNRASDDGE